MTYLVYLDEQEGEIGGEKYTAVIGFRVRLADMKNIRSSFFPAFNEIVDEKERGANCIDAKHIHKLPVLHGSNFLSDFDESLKFRVLDELAESIKPTDCGFIRLGYFDRSIPAETNLSGRNQILELALLGVALSLWDKPDDDYLLVSEIDKEALRQRIETIFNDNGQHHVLPPENFSYNVSRLVGHYYAPKSELGCQIADVINYCCLKKNTATSKFQKKMSKYYDLFAGRYIVNQIIWLNDRKNNFIMKQTNSIPTESEKLRTNPIQAIRKINPSDERLETIEIPAVERARSS